MKIDRGVVAAMSAAVLFGLSTPLAKTLVGSTPPLLLAGLLYVGSGSGLAVLLVIRAVTGGRGSITWPRGTDVWWLLGAIAAGGVIGPYLPFTVTLVVAGLLMGGGVWLHLTEHHEHLHRHIHVVHEHPHTHDEHHQHQHGPEWDGKEPHSHSHVHEPLEHAHAHYPDVHHRHEH